MSEQLAMDLTAAEVAKDSRGGHRSSNFPWTEEQIKRLKELRTAGISFGLIAESLGCSRNAAIGKAGRLGLCAHHSEKSNPLGNKKLSRVRKPPTIPDDYQSPSLDVVSLNISFLDLQPQQCRYVIGQPNGINTLYCGHPVEGEGSYCRCHFMACHELPWKIRQAMKVAA